MAAHVESSLKAFSSSDGAYFVWGFRWRSIKYSHGHRSL